MFFNNPARKIKVLAKVLFVVEVVLSVLGWIILNIIAIDTDEPYYASIAILVVLLGVPISWISNLLLYGYGSLIESNEIIAENTRDNYDFGFDLKEEND